MSQKISRKNNKRETEIRKNSKHLGKKKKKPAT